MEKKFVNWICKEKIFNNWWSVINISIKLEDLQNLRNDKGYINMTLCERKEVGKYGETHYLILNEYDIKEKEEKPEKTTKIIEIDDISIEDIPF